MEEMKCSVCGSTVNSGDSFCQNCGSPVVASAPVENTTESVQVEAPVMPETTVLSGNPYSLNDGGQKPSPEMKTASPEPSPEVNTTYQQAPAMDTNYQGTYTGTYTSPAFTQTSTTTPEKKPSKALGIVGLVLAIIGLLTSCCFGGYLFGLAAIIIGIIAIAKQKGKGLGIAGLIIGVVSLIISIVFSFIGGGFWAAFMEEFDDSYGSYDDYDYDFDDDFDLDDDSYNDDDAGVAHADDSIYATNQIMVDDTIYTLPDSLNNLGLSVNDYYSDVVSDIETNGMYAGDYEFVIFDSADGSSFWGYIENTGSDTVYSVGDLQVTGINVDNYSTDCTAYYGEVYGGVTLYMSRDEVESLIGTCDYTDDGLDAYESDGGNTVLRIEYDEDDYVCALDITVY